MAESSATRIELTTISGASLRRYAGADVDDLLAKADPSATTFVHVVRPSVALSTKILDHFGLPRLLAEQIDAAAPLELDTSSDRYLFKQFRFVEEAAKRGGAPDEAAAASVLIRGSETDRLMESSGSVIVAEKLLLLFEDRAASPLAARAIEDVLHRERELRERGIEYLVYRLSKTIFVDNYFALMRRLLDRLQDLEAPLLEGSTDAKIYREVTRVRRELNPFERSLIHAAEFTRELTQEKPAVEGGFSHLFDALATNCERLDKEFSMLRERTSELIDTYRDNVNSQLNNIMRSLTVISAMFMPLSFITSFYGMNFTTIPALNWRGGFPIAITLMLLIAVGSLTYARRKKWL